MHEFLLQRTSNEESVCSSAASTWASEEARKRRTTPSVSSIPYRPEIDGLRAVAVVPVILYHMGSGVPGGYAGVDVFFVISGYLIFSIILRDYKQGRFSFLDFWSRRIRRIMPALISMVLATSAAACFIVYAPEINEVGKQGASSLLSLANVYIWLTTGNYWGGKAEETLLLHTWSLSVEEQFYVISPLLIILLHKLFRGRLVVPVLVLVIASFLLFLYGVKQDPTATFYLLPTRSWELGAGCLLAVVSHAGKPKFLDHPSCAILGLLAIIFSYYLLDAGRGLTAWLIVPVLGTVLVLGSLKNGDPVHWLLRLRPLTYIGRISYSLYLWHWPVMVLSKYVSIKMDYQATPFHSLGILVPVSLLSYHLIEETLRYYRKTLPLILCMLLLAFLCSSLLAAKHFSEDISRYGETTWNGQLYNVSPSRQWSESSMRRMEGIKVVQPDHPNEKLYAAEGIKKLYGKEHPEIVVLGDSHALMWSSVLDDVARELGKSISFFAADGTPAFFSIPVEESQRTKFFSSEEKLIYDMARMYRLEEWQPKVVVIVSRWSAVKNMGDTEDLIEFLGRIGSKILLVEQPPELFFGDRNAPQYLAYLKAVPGEQSRAYVRERVTPEFNNGQNLLRRIVKKYAHCALITTKDIFSNNNSNLVVDGSDVLYIDDDHLSHKGSLLVRRRMLEAIRNCF